MSKYGDILGNGAKVEQIGSITIDNTVFYVIFIRSGNTLYQAFYRISDGTVNFD